MQWWKNLFCKIGLHEEKNVFGIQPSVSSCSASAKNFYFSASLKKKVNQKVTFQTLKSSPMKQRMLQIRCFLNCCFLTAVVFFAYFVIERKVYSTYLNIHLNVTLSSVDGVRVFVNGILVQRHFQILFLSKQKTKRHFVNRSLNHVQSLER